MDEQNFYQIDAYQSQTPTQRYDQPNQMVVRSDEGKGLGAVLGLAALGGLGYLIYKFASTLGDDNKPMPVNWGNAGFTGQYYGGPDGLGLIVNVTAETTSREFNAQHSFWCIDDPEAEAYLLVDERLQFWLMPRVAEVDTTSGLLKVSKASKEETQRLLELYSEKNTQASIGGFSPVKEWVSQFSEESECDEAGSRSYEVILPIPLNCGVNASGLTNTGLSSSSAWRIEKAIVKVTPLKQNKKFIDVSTNYIMIDVSNSTIGHYRMCYAGKRGDYFLTNLRDICIKGHWTTWVAAFASFGISTIVDSNSQAMRFYQKWNGKTVYPSTFNSDPTGWEIVKKAISYWSNAGGLWGVGSSAVSSLVTGLAGLKENTIVFSQGNWVNNQMDVVDLSTLFATLMISPKPIALAWNVNLPRLQQFCLCWVASVKDGIPVENGSVSLPSGTTNFKFSDLITTIKEISTGKSLKVDPGKGFLDSVTNVTYLPSTFQGSKIGRRF